MAAQVVDQEVSAPEEIVPRVRIWRCNKREMRKMDCGCDKGAGVGGQGGAPDFAARFQIYIFVSVRSTMCMYTCTKYICTHGADCRLCSGGCPAEACRLQALHMYFPGAVQGHAPVFAECVANFIQQEQYLGRAKLYKKRDTRTGGREKSNATEPDVTCR